MARARAIINLSQFQSNVAALRRRFHPNTQLAIVIKADAYGLSAAHLAPIAQNSGADWLAVATPKEAVSLRNVGITLPILLLSEPSTDSEWRDMIIHHITATLYSIDRAKRADHLCREMGKSLSYHIKVDTGMHRLGLLANGDTASLMVHFQRLHHLNFQGIFTHFSHADDRNEMRLNQQLRTFTTLCQPIKAASKTPLLCHAANSFGALTLPASHLDLVRIGLLAYDNVVSLKSLIHLIKPVQAGDGVGYDSHFIPEQDTHIGVISAGYADGIPIQLSNTGRVLIGGQFYPIVGRVCMDMTFVDLGPTLAPSIRIGDEVVFFGQQDDKSLALVAECGRLNINPREVMCHIGSRIDRVYAHDDQSIEPSILS